MTELSPFALMHNIANAPTDEDAEPLMREVWRHLREKLLEEGFSARMAMFRGTQPGPLKAVSMRGNLADPVSNRMLNLEIIVVLIPCGFCSLRVTATRNDTPDTAPGDYLATSMVNAVYLADEFTGELRETHTGMPRKTANKSVGLPEFLRSFASSLSKELSC